MRARDKIWTLTALPSIIDRADRKLVLACGCFDPLHAGHVRHLEEAKEMGDILVVVVTADRCVNKGPNRPVVPQEDRSLVVAALECVDFVAINDEYTAATAIVTLRPDLYVKGADYKGQEQPVLWAERKAVENYGGRLAFTHSRITTSSTEMLRKLTECV